MRFIALTLALCSVLQLSAQQNYWQQSVSYNIKATLDDQKNTITGSETIVYKNNSPEILSFIWFHIWPNA